VSEFEKRGHEGRLGKSAVYHVMSLNESDFDLFCFDFLPHPLCTEVNVVSFQI
jgi:hypothetical protein